MKVKRVLTAAPTSGERVIAYYFHTATRCPTCRAIESHVRDAVAAQVDVGVVEMRAVNYEEPATGTSSASSSCWRWGPTGSARPSTAFTGRVA